MAAIEPIPYDVILVGGTNGKGSVCKFLHDFLFSEGFRVGLTTSPHLLDVRERIVVEGEMISREDFDRVYSEIDAPDATYFEMLALMAIRYFKERAVDVAVVEIGLGGRLDAFNVLDPKVSVVTNIGLEHTEYLGDTLEKIEAEKVAIARPGRPLIRGSSLPGRTFREENIETAVRAARAYFEFLERPFDEARCREICEASCWPGRFEVIPGAPEIILDAAHNQPAAEALAKTLRKHAGGRKIVGCAAFLADKDIAGFFVALDELVDHWVLTEVKDARAKKAADLPAPFNSECVADSREAFARAKEAAGPSGIVLVTGSIYLLGELIPITSSIT